MSQRLASLLALRQVAVKIRDTKKLLGVHLEKEKWDLVDEMIDNGNEVAIQPSGKRT